MTGVQTYALPIPRRFERCRLVVDNSGRLGQIEMEGGSKDEHAQIMRSTLMALAAPI